MRKMMKKKNKDDDIEIISQTRYYNNYNNYNNSNSYYKAPRKNAYYNNSTRVRYGSTYYPRKYPKNLAYLKVDDDYFNKALKYEDNVYATIANENIYNNDDNDFYYYEKEEIYKTITVGNENNAQKQPKKEKEEKKDKKEMKMKRGNTIGNKSVKIRNKESKEENKKVTIKNSGAKNLKELLG